MGRLLVHDSLRPKDAGIQAAQNQWESGRGAYALIHAKAWADVKDNKDMRGHIDIS